MRAKLLLLMCCGFVAVMGVRHLHRTYLREGVVVNHDGFGPMRHQPVSGDDGSGEDVDFNYPFISIRHRNVLGDAALDDIFLSGGKKRLDIRDGSSGQTVAYRTDEYIADFGSIPVSDTDRERLVVFTYPNREGGGTFKVLRAPEMHVDAEWREQRGIGAFETVTFMGQSVLAYLQNEHLVIRDAQGHLVNSINIPHGEAFRRVWVCELDEKWIAIVASSRRSRARHMVAVVERASGRIAYKRSGEGLRLDCSPLFADSTCERQPNASATVRSRTTRSSSAGMTSGLSSLAHHLLLRAWLARLKLAGIDGFLASWTRTTWEDGEHMTEMDRRTFIAGLGAAVALAPGLRLRTLQAAAANHPALTTVNRDFLVSARQVRDWHAVKDSKGGPTLAGSPSWKNYLELLEKELRQSGVVDVVRHPFTYTRWHTTEWPDDANWSLRLDGKKIKVASYGANSGATSDAGATADLVLYKEGMPAEALRGKIAVIVKPGPDTLPPMTGDYEYLSNADTFADPVAPASELRVVNPFRLMGLTTAQAPLIAAGAAGAIIVMPFSYEVVAGLYTFGVPEIHQMPTLYVDREAGAPVIDAATAGKRATLRLVATTEQADTHQLFGYLPGKDYGTPNDSQVLLVTHTDGPSISQENGALGILSMVRYFSRVPQAERPRTLMVFLDCRHYMPGAERAFARQDYVVTRPDLYKRVIASMGIEHLGQIKVEERQGQPYHKTNLAELSSLWATNNQKLIDLAVRAVKDNGLSRVQVQCPDRPGSHGKSQAPWYGLGSIAGRLKVPGYGAMGLLSAYWTTRARLEYLDADHFVTQVATLSQICGGLMTADIAEIKTA